MQTYYRSRDEEAEYTDLAKSYHPESVLSYALIMILPTGTKPNSVSMANELERESLKRENAALKERLKNTIAIQEKLRDSEASLKRQLLVADTYI